jgi:hypothetical protein
MKENSPIWERPAATTTPVSAVPPNSRTSTKAASAFPTMMIATTTRIRPTSARRKAGSISIPTETKKRTANASRNGKASSAAR